MKIPVLLLLLSGLPFCVVAQTSPCKLKLLREQFSVADTIRFDLITEKDVEVEVSVFSAQQVLLLQRDRLREGNHAYRIPSGSSAPGRFTILIQGEGFRESVQFTLD